jgi:hypothetical protein
MSWRHYEARQRGSCIIRDMGLWEAAYELGSLETGRSRVWAGHYIRVTTPNGDQITGEDGGDLRAALKKVAGDIAAQGLRLDCVGLSKLWRESGLSYNSGFGYYGPEQKPMHMMDAIPGDEESESLDRMIREAVDGMRIGLL